MRNKFKMNKTENKNQYDLEERTLEFARSVRFFVERNYEKVGIKNMIFRISNLEFRIL